MQLLRKILLVVLAGSLLAACTPAATGGEGPISSSTPIPPTATVPPTKTFTPSPTPESLAAAGDLPLWIGEFTAAYGGRVTVGGAEMDANQLLAEVSAHSELYLDEKTVDGVACTFLVVNEVPLAVRFPGEAWREVTLSVMGRLTGIETGTVIVADTASIPETWWEIDNTIGTAVLDYRTMSPDRDTIDFSYPNYQARIIREWSGLPSRIQAALFWNSRPAWLGDDFTLEDLDHLVRVFMENARANHFSEVVVVNETGNTEDRDDPFFEKFGDEFVLRAYRLAREIDPGAKLIYNDQNNHLPGSVETMYTRHISEALLAEGLIDYVGVEMHISHGQNDPDLQELVEIFRSYPVPVLITEFDVTMDGVGAADRDAVLNRIVETVYAGCLESGVCKGITLWNYADWEVPGTYSLRGMHDEKKQAYYVATSVMYRYLP